VHQRILFKNDKTSFVGENVFKVYTCDNGLISRMHKAQLLSQQQEEQQFSFKMDKLSKLYANPQEAHQKFLNITSH
jgi:hypothetical protein